MDKTSTPNFIIDNMQIKHKFMQINEIYNQFNRPNYYRIL